MAVNDGFRFEPFEPCWVSTSEWSHFDAFHAVELALARGFLSRSADVPALSRHSSPVASESTLSRRQRAKADWYCAKFLSIYRSRSFLRPYRSRLLKADGRLRRFISNSFSLRRSILQRAARLTPLRRHRRAFERANTRFHDFFSSFWSRVADLVVQSWCDAPVINFTLPLSDDDRALARKWRTDDSPDEDDRLYNARRAEISANHYYRGLGYSVVDVALQQLHSVEEGDWRTHDLEVSGRPVDVKNLRGDPGRRGVFGYRVTPPVSPMKIRPNGPAAGKVAHANLRSPHTLSGRAPRRFRCERGIHHGLPPAGLSKASRARSERDVASGGEASVLPWVWRPAPGAADARGAGRR